MRTHSVLLLDIDDDTWEAWDDPLFVPRDKLARLVDYALSGQARLLVIDVTLGSRTGKDDERLLRAIADGAHTHPDVPVILMRDLRYWRKQDRVMEKESYLQAAGLPSNVWWVNSLFDRDSDGVVRRWRSWECVCSQQGECQRIPNSELAAFAALREGVSGIGKVREALSAMGGRCEDRQNMKTQLVSFAGTTVDLSHTRLGRRISYSIAEGEDALPAVETVSAGLVTQAEEPPDPKILLDRAVIIGSSAVRAGDRHLTPLGEMPGSLIIVNAAQSLLKYGEIHTLSLGMKLLLQVPLVVFVSLALLRVHGFWANVCSMMIVLLVLIPAALLALHSGIWIDFALPLLVVQLHRMALDHYRRLRDET